MNWSKEKKSNIKYSVVSLLLAVVAYLININFREDLPRKISESLFWLIIPIFVFSVIVFFMKRNIFSTWAKMTNYFFIISVTIVLVTPTSTHGLDFVPLVKETVTIALASIYSFVSLFLIVYKSFKESRLSY